MCAYAYENEADAVETGDLDEYFRIPRYDDFLVSNCVIVVAVCDCEFVDIAAKDEEVISTIQKSAENAGFTDIKIITEKDTDTLFLGF